MANMDSILKFLDDNYIRNGGFSEHLKELFTSKEKGERQIHADDVLPASSIRGRLFKMKDNMVVFELTIFPSEDQ